MISGTAQLTLPLRRRLADGTLTDDTSVTCELESAGGLGISVAGYGTADVVGGPIIYLENGEEGLRLYVWPNVASEEPVVINLETARETTPSHPVPASTAAPT
jgi:hypothetical protein